MGLKLIEEFSDIIEKIKHEDFRIEVVNSMQEAPDYVTNIPSSSTGKYHPQDEINSNGMCIHIRRCAILAEEVLRMRYEDNDADRDRDLDILLAASMIHDSYKNGHKEKNNLPINKYTHPWHPIWAFWNVSKIAGNLPKNTIVREMMWALGWVCLFHEGKWTIKKAKETAKNAKMEDWVSQLCKDMHTVDYMVSRRTLADAFQYDSH